MPPENDASADRSDAAASSNDLPAIEDAYAPDESSEQVVADDDPQLLNATTRILEGAADQSDADDELIPTPATSAAIDTDDTSDTGGVAGEPEARAETTEAPKPPKWDSEMSAHKIVVELKRIETEVRQLLEGRDSKRKRKLGGTRRWQELTDDIITWRYAGRIDETTLRRLQDLVTRRHYLFQRLRFLAGTRPTWNT